MVLMAIVLGGFTMMHPASHAKKPLALHSIKLFLVPERGCAGRGRAFKIRTTSHSKAIAATTINYNGMHVDFTLSSSEVQFVSCEQFSTDLSVIAYEITRASYVPARRSQR